MKHFRACFVLLCRTKRGEDFGAKEDNELPVASIFMSYPPYWISWVPAKERSWYAADAKTW